MRKYNIIIDGVSTIKMNRFTEEAKESLSGGGVKKSREEKIAEAWDRTYKNENGEYTIPAKAIKACIERGGSKVSMGRGKARSILEAIFFVERGSIVFKHSDPIVLEDVVRIPPKTGARQIKYWIGFEQWSCIFDSFLTDDIFPVKALQESIRAAGLYYGLLDERPDYGRFILLDFKEL